MSKINVEDIEIEEDLDSKSMSYRDVFDRLDKYTDGFTKEDSEFPLDTKSELEVAEAILKNKYKTVAKSGLDYDNSNVDKTMYKIKFKDPYGLQITPDKSPEAANRGPMGTGLGISGIGESMINERLNEEDMSSAKSRFINYCSGKIQDLGDVTFERYEEKITMPVDMIGDVRSFDNVRITSDEDGESFICIDQSGKVVVDTSMIDVPGYASRLEFKAIDKRFYNEVLEYWDDLYMDDMIEDDVDNESLTELYINESLNKEESLDEAAKHDELNPDIWDENRDLRPEVKEKLLEIVQKFDDNLKNDGVELDVKDIVIIGSNANYNYTDKSDIDLHVVADTSVYRNSEELAMKVYQAYKTLFNNHYDPVIRGHDVEIYVEPDSIHANSNGIYSLNTGWVKEPIKDNVPEFDKQELAGKLQPFIDRFNEIETVEDADSLLDDIYLQRQRGILKDGEFSIDNQVFKEFRNEGYLDKLKDKKAELETKEMSLESYIFAESLLEDSDSLTNNPDRKTKVFNDPKKAKEFLGSLPKEAEGRMDFFDNDSIYAVDWTWEVYYWGDAVDEDLTEDSDDYLEEAKSIAYDLNSFIQKQQYAPSADLIDWDIAPMESFKVTFEVDGDWKHDHLYFNSICNKWAEQNDKHIWKIDEFEIGESEYDSYDAEHVVYIINKEDLDKFNNMARLFRGNADESLNETVRSSKDDLNHGYNISKYDSGHTQITKHRPYDDADYYWATLKDDGWHIIFKGYTKEVIETEDPNEVADRLAELNKDIEARIITDSLNEEISPRAKETIDWYLDPKNVPIEDALSEDDYDLFSEWMLDDDIEPTEEMFKYFLKMQDKRNDDIVLRAAWKKYENESLNEATDEFVTMIGYDVERYVSTEESESTFEFNEGWVSINPWEYVDELGRRGQVMFLRKDDAISFARNNVQAERVCEVEFEAPRNCIIGDKAYDVTILTDPEDEVVVWTNGNRRFVQKSVKETLTEGYSEEDKIEALSKHLEIDPSRIVSSYDEFDTPVGTYFVGTEDEAYDRAVEDISALLDDMGIEAFSKDWIDRNLDNFVDDYSFATDFVDQEIDYFENEEEDPDMLAYLNKIKDDPRKCVSYMKGIYGKDEIDKELAKHINVKKLADAAIDEDGIAHFISYYDGNEIDLGNGLYAYRMN